jgi:hypothetical protein
MKNLKRSNNYYMYTIPVAGAGLGSVYTAYRANQLKKLDNETDYEFSQRRKRHIIAGGLGGGSSGAILAHGVKHKGQAFGSALGMSTSGIMMNSGIDFKNMSPERQDAFLRAHNISTVVSGASGAVMGRLTSTKKVPGLKKESELSKRIYNIL